MVVRDRRVLLVVAVFGVLALARCGSHDRLPSAPSETTVAETGSSTELRLGAQACAGTPGRPAASLYWPLEGRRSDYTFGRWDATWPWGSCNKAPKRHTGLDITRLDGGAMVGRRVRAVQDGIAHRHNLGNGWGLGLVVEHDGWSSSYEHVTPLVNDHDRVSRGQWIATVAPLTISVPHLHFGIRMQAYSAGSVAARGALPSSAGPSTPCSCKDANGYNDPVWPELFIDPAVLAYAEDPAPQPLRIGQVSPAATVGSVFVMTISGSGFDPASAGDQVYQPSGGYMGHGVVQSRSASQLVVRQSMAGAAPGTYTVRVRNGNGALSNAAGFTLYAEVRVSPATGPAGTRFSYSGYGFSPYGAASHLLRPNGVEFPLLQVPTDGLGQFARTIDSSGFAPGTYQVWAQDKNTGSLTKRVSFQVR